ncbi:E3 ubiquitin protein ligase DRIP2-like [Olea europaea var. sylvestris]|uniref:E3 ubiquitin protein ligase DRIP2-like n=1 Tax=Olea europaea var. sylvestris TaxID=158386 RepID=UPI000C1D02ED|nr:E3 ubiquitin protein ligase DRIP2-like [Olea europaea var. sylvestris]XP_022854152.1 E3 ubiquitin protein ligase DRIP2-like [Olea europaea var. sylvestris]
MPNQVVKVKREAVLPCMTCPLCRKLFHDATTIIECLHTFCRNCIYKKLSDEEMECCPICNINLGCAPLEKLRPDHKLQDVRAKIFSSKRKVNTPEVVTPVQLPAKRKERSLSSLAISAPRVSAHSGMTGRRSKSIARKASRSSSFTIEKAVDKDEDSVEDCPENSKSPERLNKVSQNTRLNPNAAEASSRLSPDEERERGSEALKGKVDLWKPLNCLVEAANRSKSSQLAPQGSVAKSDSIHFHGNEGLVRKSKNKEAGTKSKVQHDKNGKVHDHGESEKTKKIRRIQQKKARNSGELRITHQDVLNAATATCEKRNNPIWFSLVASDDQEGDAHLPQISANYLRIKDGSIPVSFIQKYLKKKLDLTNEDEVEIKCMGQTVVPTLTLNNLVDIWLQTTTSETVSATIGSSAKDFMMVLSYSRKAPDI